MALGETARAFAKSRPTYKDVLSPDQVREMESFLRALRGCSSNAKEKGIQVDIADMLNAWRGAKGRSESKQCQFVSSPGSLSRKYKTHSVQYLG